MTRAAAILLALLALCLAMIVVLTMRPANAAPGDQCGPMRAVVQQMLDRYHEFVVMTGDATGQKMVVTMSAAGTFTVILQDREDASKACVVLAGDKAEFDNGI